MTQTNDRRARRLPTRQRRQLSPGDASEDVSASPGYEHAPSLTDEDLRLARELHLSQALVEAAITNLDLDKLLHALLDPIKDIMGVDNVAILLCSADGQHLLLQAAHGLEEEAVGRAIVPIGQGFAGRVAASRRLLVVPDLAEFDAVNPVLRERLRSVAGTPLLAGGRLLGVLHIGTGQPHTFSDHELSMLQRVAEHVALAIDRALLFRAEHESRRASERQMRRTREALDALLELAGAMVSSPVTPDMPDTLDTPATLPDNPMSDTQQQDDEAIRILAGLYSRILGCERIAIISVDSETGRMRPITVSGSLPELESQFRAGFSDLHFQDRFGPEIVAELQAGESVLVDLNTMTLDESAHLLSRRYFLLSPIRASGALVGYIGANFGDSADDYTEENRTLAHAAAQLIGIVMERQRLSRERADAQADAISWERAKRQMDEFLSIASHELLTPITSAKVNVQMVTRLLDSFLRADEDTPANTRDSAPPANGDAMRSLVRARELLRRADRQFTRQERLINDLLDLSRTDAGKLVFRFAVCDFAALARVNIEEQRAAHPERLIHFSAPDQPVFVNADGDRLIQVADNLLLNALKYSAPDTPVTVRLQVEGASARYEVEDAGPGLRPEDQKRIWQRYYRVAGGASQPEAGPGLGLGLYISKTIIERHGGEIGVESVLGKGSTFWFTVPLSPAD